MTNEFEEMYNTDEFNKDVSTDSVATDNVKQPKTSEPVVNKPTETEIADEEMSPDRYAMDEYIKTPDVGESVEFTIDKIINVKDPKKHRAKNKLTGEEFVVGVERKDKITIRVDIQSTDGKKFVLNSWALFMLFQDRHGKFAEEVRKRGTYKGIKVKLTRIYDGSVPNKKDSDVMKLYNLESIEAAVKYKKEVSEAMQKGNLFKIEFLN